MTPEEIRKSNEAVLRRDWSTEFIKTMKNKSQGIITWSDEFVEKMQKSILLSHEKYGWMSKTYPELAQAIKCAAERVVAYQKTHNKDYLIDIANFAMIEYMYPSGKKAHFYKTTFTACDPSDNLACMADRLQSYLDMENKLYLVDLAAYAMQEYVNPSYDDAHYTPGDSDKSTGLAGGISYKQMMEDMQS